MIEIGKERPLSLDVFEAIVLKKNKVQLSQQSIAAVQTAQEYLLGRVAEGQTIYGVNTGFGLFSNVRISEEEIRELQVNLLRSHAVGVGHPMPDSVVRGMLLLRAHQLALGHSGVSVQLIERLITLLNEEVYPIVPQQGSVGASGDLAPLAHLALPLIGEGQVRYRGEILPADEVLKALKLVPLELGPKEGLALINGTQFMSSVGALAVLEAGVLFEASEAIGAMSLEAFRGTDVAFDALIQEVRVHPGQNEVAARLRSWLNAGSKESPKRSEIGLSHENCDRVQDPYSFRCMPQVQGASWDLLNFVRGVLEREMNAITDNPLVFPERGRVLSGGNFHGQLVANAMDVLSIASAEIASISEQRIEKLINPAISELPAFLIKKGGLNSGMMIVQVAAASIVSENKTLAHPASVDSIPTSADKEDHVSMGAWAARKAQRVVTNLKRVLSMELLCAAQAIDLLRPMRTTPRLEKIHAKVRLTVPFAEKDRSFYLDLKSIDELLSDWSAVRELMHLKGEV